MPPNPTRNEVQAARRQDFEDLARLRVFSPMMARYRLRVELGLAPDPLLEEALLDIGQALVQMFDSLDPTANTKTFRIGSKDELVRAIHEGVVELLVGLVIKYLKWDDAGVYNSGEPFHVRSTVIAQRAT